MRLAALSPTKFSPSPRELFSVGNIENYLNLNTLRMIEEVYNGWFHTSMKSPYGIFLITERIKSATRAGKLISSEPNSKINVKKSDRRDSLELGHY